MENQENKDLQTSEELEAQSEIDTEIADEVIEENTEPPKKERKPKKEKMHSAYAFKRGSYATIITAVFIVGVIVLNILATALSQRFPLQWDLSAQQINSLTDQNKDNIKKITRDVSVILCATEEQYSGGYFTSYAAQSYNAEDASGKYFAQTVNLLKEYEKYNDKIKITFADTSAPSFSETIAKFKGTNPNQKIGFGDILVESTFQVAGKDISRTKIISFADIYELNDPTGGYAQMGYGKYAISGSNLETALTSALFSVTADKTTKLAYSASYTDPAIISKLSSTLAYNNYEVMALESTGFTKIPEDSDGIIIAAPANDPTDAEIAAIEKFLDNGGKKGKTLVYFASSQSPALPRLEEFLSEWGIAYDDGIIYETDDRNIANDNTQIIMTNKQTEYTKDINNAEVIYVSGGNVPMKAVFQGQNGRETAVVLSSSKTAVIKPAGSKDDWKPGSTDTKAEYPTAIASKETKEEKSSYVIAFASVDMIASSWTEYQFVGNINLVLSAVDTATGRDNEGVSFVKKSITNESFSDKVTKSSSTTMMVIFMFMIPITLIVVGITVWYRRKNR